MVNDPNTIRKGLNDTLAKHFMTSGFDNNKDLQKLNKFIQNWGEAIDDSSKAYKNAVMLNLLDEAHMNKAALLGMNAKGSAFGLATAQTHAKQSFIMSGSMAGEFLPLIKAIVHIIIAIMSVFLIMLSIMFMQPMFVKTFVTLNLWIVFWSPLIAIINFIMIYNIEKVVNYVKSQGYDPFSVLGSNMLDGKILDYLAYEGTLAWLVPILAFAIASGSAQGFVAFASSLSQQFASASMMGARQVTGMATQGSQSIRDGNSTYTKDGSGITRLTTSIAGGQKVDYAIKYGNTDKAQEVEARGTNFSYKTDAEAMMMTGRFDNLALNKGMSSGTNSGHTQQSGDNQNITKGGGVSETGSIVVTDTFKDGEDNRKGHGNKRDFSENYEKNDTKSLDKDKTDSRSVKVTETKSAAEMKTGKVSGDVGIGSGGKGLKANVGSSVEYAEVEKNQTDIQQTQDKNLKSSIKDGTTFNVKMGTGDSEHKSNEHGFTQGRDHSVTATTNKNYNDSTNYQNGQTSSQTDNYGTSQSENTSLSHNSVAATMNAKMIASGMSGMSFEERLNYLSTQMAEMGNMSALSKDVGAMNDKLDAGIQGVSDNTYKVDTTPIAKKTEERKREVGNEHNRIQNSRVKDTTNIVNLADSGMRIKSVNGVEGLYDANDKLIHSREELEKNAHWVQKQGYYGTDGVWLAVGNNKYVLGSEADKIKEWAISGVNRKI